MAFHSAAFLLFFPTVVVCYYALPHRFRWLLLLAASYVFYTWWEPVYGLLLFGSTTLDYVLARAMGARETRRARRRLLAVSLLANLGLLFLFKYFDFAGRSGTALGDWLGFEFVAPSFDWLLPIGISFYTFQTVGYAIDVYRGERPPERHFGRFALYVSFFPQLVAGPIERSTRLLPQFLRQVEFDPEQVAAGLRQMLWGFFKKLVIADRAAVVVDAIYAAPGDQTGASLAIATYLFAIQIYCDFSGYSDIAIGAARVLGIDLMENFRVPYAARSLREFWSRWHISLSTWFRDYVYVSLGGNRRGERRRLGNLLCVFAVSGLWHGASWTFVVWGLYHGAARIAEEGLALARRRLVGERSAARGPSRIGRLASWAVTFHVVVLGWVWFRAASFGDALAVFRGLASFGAWPDTLGSLAALPAFEWAVLGVALLTLIALERRGSAAFAERVPGFVPRAAPVYALLASVLLLGRIGSYQSFIYFQF